MATVVVTVGSMASGSGTVSNVSGSDPWTLTMSASFYALSVVGDIWTETSGGRVYLITAISEDRLSITVTDINAAGGSAPAAVDGYASRAYSGVVSAELNITNMGLVSGDTWECRLMNDAIILDGLFVMTADVVGSTGTIKFTSPVGERDLANIGSGTRVQCTQTGYAWNLKISTNTPNYIVEYFEIIGFNGVTNTSFGIAVTRAKTGQGDTVIRNLALHDGKVDVGSGNYYAALGLFVGPVDVFNCLIFDIDNQGGGGKGRGIFVISDTEHRIHNCTIERCSTEGIRSESGTSADIQNTATLNANYVNNGTQTGGNNATDESSAPGSNNQVNLVASEQFVSLVDGSEDYTPGAHANQALVANGADLSAIFTDDLLGQIRVDWDIGAIELLAVVESSGSGCWGDDRYG